MNILAKYLRCSFVYIGILFIIFSNAAHAQGTLTLSSCSCFGEDDIEGCLKCCAGGCPQTGEDPDPPSTFLPGTFLPVEGFPGRFSNPSETNNLQRNLFQNEQLTPFPSPNFERPFHQIDGAQTNDE